MNWDEENHYPRDKKEFRKERKRLTLKDRSKFKKTDQAKLKKQTKKVEGDLLRGRVLAITPDGILVDANEKLYTCSLKGSLKQEKSKLKNLIAVGDFVHINADEASIVAIEERTSILSRADNLMRRKEQLIAVNIDLVLITASVLFPPLKPGLIDRYIIATLKGGMQPAILINKVDFLENPPSTINPQMVAEEKALFEEVMEVYKNLGIPVLAVSTQTGQGLSELKGLMRGRACVFSGQSGTGKTSLINFVTGSSLRIGEVIAKTRKGSHTTTSTHLLPLDEGGFCIDTPGIKSFGLWDLKAEEIQDYFPEIAERARNCKYIRCLHLTEPDCAVKQAVSSGLISHLRFESYCALMSDRREKHRPR